VPSIVLREPRVMVAASVICAESIEEAKWLSGSSALSIVQMRTGHPGELPSPEEAAAYSFTPIEEQIATEAMSSHLIGDPTTVAEGLSRLQTRTTADEIMISTRVHSLEARIKSLTLVAKAWGISETFEPHSRA
jgi:alkanesulfonate monooxygenase SsuD/methylene tetrahydromethanopterin reductase-like flavin-dependent oxidoreductase (luciferase family)